MARCLVTGACGFMGSHMVEVLAEHGEEIIATDLPAAYEGDDLARQRFPSVLKRCGAQFVGADITDRASLKKIVRGVEKVFHIAAIFSYNVPWRALQKVNVEGTQNLFSLLRNQPIQRIVLWGAGGIYGLPKKNGSPFREEDPKNPGNPYLKSKWLQEKWAWDFCKKHKLPMTSIRPTGAYGPRATYGLNKLILTIAQSKKPLTAKNFNFAVPTDHVRDICEAAYFLTTREEAAGEAYHVNDGCNISYSDFVKTIAELQGKSFVEIPPVPVPLLREVLKSVAVVAQGISRLTKAPPLIERDQAAYFGLNFVYSNEKIRQLGFQSRYADVREGLQDTLHWMKSVGVL